jgi:hypothetical protein
VGNRFQAFAFKCNLYTATLRDPKEETASKQPSQAPRDLVGAVQVERSC